MTHLTEQQLDLKEPAPPKCVGTVRTLRCFPSEFFIDSPGPVDGIVQIVSSITSLLFVKRFWGLSTLNWGFPSLSQDWACEVSGLTESAPETY